MKTYLLITISIFLLISSFCAYINEYQCATYSLCISIFNFQLLQYFHPNNKNK